MVMMIAGDLLTSRMAGNMYVCKIDLIKVKVQGSKAAAASYNIIVYAEHVST